MDHLLLRSLMARSQLTRRIKLSEMGLEEIESECIKALRLSCTSRTHLGRNVAARDAEHAGALKSSIERHGE